MSDEAENRILLFHRRALEEYLKARRRYAKQATESVAHRSTEELDQALEAVRHWPQRGGVFRETYRWVRLRRFPYLVYYRVVDDDTIVILAVAHASRRPGYWLKRDVLDFGD
jgi:toxin ParE1/3/4